MCHNTFHAIYYSHFTGTATAAVWTQGYANFAWAGAAAFAFGLGALVADAYSLVLGLFTRSVAAGVVCSLEMPPEEVRVFS